MEALIEFFQYDIALRALLAASVVGVMCGILGCFIVLRHMALIGDGIAHAILPGVAVAFVLMGFSTLGFFLGSVGAGLLTAILITWIQRNVVTKNDAAIGIVYTAMFAIGVILITSINQEGVHFDLEDFLIGNVLGVSDEDIFLMLFVLIYVIISVVLFYRYLFVSTFQPVIAETMGISVQVLHYFLMLLLSFTVVAALRAVGMILTVAMLITPAASALLLSERLHKVLYLSAAIGLGSAVSGLMLAIIFNAPPGPMMVVVCTLVYLLAILFAPKRGLIFRYWRRLKLQRRIQLEDMLKQAFRLEEQGTLSVQQLKRQLGDEFPSFGQQLRRLEGRSWASQVEGRLQLTEAGRQVAARLVRAHRLWETYLVKEIGLNEQQIHEDAERYEHLLTDDILDEVDQQLGYPAEDPHGSPIPGKPGLPNFPLIKLEPMQSATLTATQVNAAIGAKLWQLGLQPHQPVSITRKEQDAIAVQQGDKEIEISPSLARMINVELVP